MQVPCTPHMPVSLAKSGPWANGRRHARTPGHDRCVVFQIFTFTSNSKNHPRNFLLTFPLTSQYSFLGLSPRVKHSAGSIYPGAGRWQHGETAERRRGIGFI